MNCVIVPFTEPSSVYDNNIYHEECLRCNACGVNLTGPSQKRARRFKNQIFCDLHFADVALMESSDFMQQLRSFKPQSLGCAVARRKSSTTLIFPLPPQACSGKTYQLRCCCWCLFYISDLWRCNNLGGTTIKEKERERKSVCRSRIVKKKNERKDR